MLNLTSGAASSSGGLTGTVPVTGPGTGALPAVIPAVLTAAQIAALAAAVVAATPALPQHQELYSKILMQKTSILQLRRASCYTPKLSSLFHLITGLKSQQTMHKS
eukprot:9449462-Ditylum_brightwellii.AAC.1